MVLQQAKKGSLTVLLQLGKAMVTHSSWLVLQVLQVVLIGRARLTHHLPAGAAVMPPPRQGELAGADHAHGSPQVWDPDGSFRT